MTIIKEEHVKLRNWTTAEYRRLIEHGILSSADKVELLDGQIVNMSPAGNYHAAFIEFLADILRKTLPADTQMIRTQNPIALSANSEPEPDLAVVRHRRDYYAHAHPGVEDISLLIEVAETSINKDRHVKSLLYAEAGIPEYWIINLEGEVLEQYRHPEDGRYRMQRIYGQDEALDSSLLPAVKISDIWL